MSTSQWSARLQQQLDRSGLCDVEADVSFPGVLLNEVGGEAIDPRIDRSRDVAFRRLDLDHIGSEVSTASASHAVR